MSHDDRAERFKELHRWGTFVLPNAWDAASAAVMARAGAPALATTSSGISWSLGVPDGERLGRRQAVAAVARIVGAVDVPVSADVEAGYGPAPGDVADTVAAVGRAGAVGVNIEDRRRDGAGPLWAIDEQCRRLEAARAAADRSGAALTVNARTDVYLAAVGEPPQREARVLERARAYAAAGADCLFVPGLSDLDVIRRIAASSPLPLNVLLAPHRGPGIAALAEAGVRRVSVGSLLAAHAYGAVERATRALLSGDAEPLTSVIPHPELQQLMETGALNTSPGDG